MKSKLFVMRTVFQVPENTDPDTFISNVADALDEMLGESPITYCFQFGIEDSEDEIDVHDQG